ncbi:MAG: transketolase [Lewinellaceae bacterium]|nr:transketolase [Saprospiraceae bacterium]MCB9311271.1 transketolase [Lewinellaceae bacterium]
MEDLVREEPTADVKAFENEVLRDYWITLVSREASILARKEVLTGKAKFGIVGDGKEVPQVALARYFRNGDWRSGYYRDQTLMFALGLSTIDAYFAQLYADPDNDPFSGGRQMNSHYATPLIDQSGQWLAHRDMKNVSADISSTAGQMARALGLALASKKYRERPDLAADGHFSDQGNEVVYCTIGDASTSEGVFWETMNAAAVQQVPLIVSVWDDGYGISVPIDYQTTKKSISKALSGFHSEVIGEGMLLVTVKAWDYPQLCRVYEEVSRHVRETHQPALVHVREVTQPQGHSTSGSHERYKSKERLAWEEEYDCIHRMGNWILEQGFATQEELDQLRDKARQEVREARDRAWTAYNQPIQAFKASLQQVLDAAAAAGADMPGLAEAQAELINLRTPLYSELVKLARRLLLQWRGWDHPVQEEIAGLVRSSYSRAAKAYHSHLYSETDESALRVPVVPAVFSEESPLKNGFEILNTFFDTVLDRDPRFMAFGEDVGKIGDVNQGFAGLQSKYGEEKVFDAGIREWTIMGQAIGLAMRGLRPLAEIQYLDYLIYGLEPLTDDLATVRYRSNGIQKAPAIIRTRGHRLEGIWHAGSPIGMLIHSLRGIHVCVPRNMTQAAGMYNTLLRSDDPGLVIECLNGYRLKERLPDNLSDFTVPFGVPEVLREGSHLTLVTYGSCVRIAEEAIQLLTPMGIDIELIDVQTLLPFDLEGRIVHSLAKTNRVIFLDEDVPGGASSYMMQQVLEVQGGYQLLDSAPATLTAKAHRPPYGSDGDYFSKPNAEDICDLVLQMMHEAYPDTF